MAQTRKKQLPQPQNWKIYCHCKNEAAWESSRYYLRNQGRKIPTKQNCFLSVHLASRLKAGAMIRCWFPHFCDLSFSLVGHRQACSAVTKSQWARWAAGKDLAFSFATTLLPSFSENKAVFSEIFAYYPLNDVTWETLSFSIVQDGELGLLLWWCLTSYTWVCCLCEVRYVHWMLHFWRSVS